MIFASIWAWLTRRPKQNAYSDLRRYADTLECIVVRLVHEYPTTVECLTNHERKMLVVARAARAGDTNWEPGYGNRKFRLPSPAPPSPTEEP